MFSKDYYYYYYSNPSLVLLPNILIICIFFSFFWAIFLSHIYSILLRWWACPQSVVFLYFMEVETARYFINVFMCSFLDQTQGSHYYWYGGSLKETHFLNSSSRLVYLFILLYSLTNMLSVSTDISIRKHIFLL